MKLDDFKRSGKGTHKRFASRVTDAASQEEFEFTIAGPEALVQEMLADAEIDLTIDSQQSQDQLTADFESAHKEQRKSVWDLAALRDVDALLKPAPEPPQPNTTVFAAIRPVGGHGTPFALLATGFFVPTNASFFFSGSWVFSAIGSVLPTSGDQDLFLHFFTGTGPTVMSSTFGGTSLDVVAFSVPLFPWVPVFEVKGFTAGVCSTFAANGA